jgi:hypothetical protein
LHDKLNIYWSKEYEFWLCCCETRNNKKFKIAILCNTLCCDLVETGVQNNPYPSTGHISECCLILSLLCSCL